MGHQFKDRKVRGISQLVQRAPLLGGSFQLYKKFTVSINIQELTYEYPENGRK